MIIAIPPAIPVRQSQDYYIIYHLCNLITMGDGRRRAWWSDCPETQNTGESEQEEWSLAVSKRR